MPFALLNDFLYYRSVSVTETYFVMKTNGSRLKKIEDPSTDLCAGRFFHAFTETFSVRLSL